MSRFTHTLFWKFCASFGLAAVVLVWAVGQASSWIERQMSLLAEPDKQEMRQWAREAEQLLRSGQMQELEGWLDRLQRQEDTLITVVQVEEKWLTPGTEEQFVMNRLGRKLHWPVHLHHDNPIIQVPFSDGVTSLAIRLPDRMVPGRYWPQTYRALQVMPSLLLMLLLSAVLYRHLMTPIRRLQAATRRFDAGDYDVRVRQTLGRRQDELADLASTFDRMAAHTGGLIRNQRHLIRDLSHELRTPLTRLELALDDSQQATQLRERGRKEAQAMRELVEDTLALAGLDHEPPPVDETVDLELLLEAITDDARYEFPDRSLSLALSCQPVLDHSNERALSQALENIIRNALRHTPEGLNVAVTVRLQSGGYEVQVQDEGPGVPQEHLENIFLPFFRIDRSRSRKAGGAGLGLALARRQISAIGGRLDAFNHPQGGLVMRVWLPGSDCESAADSSDVKSVNSVKNVKGFRGKTYLNEN